MYQLTQCPMSILYCTQPIKKVKVAVTSTCYSRHSIPSMTGRHLSGTVLKFSLSETECVKKNYVSNPCIHTLFALVIGMFMNYRKPVYYLLNYKISDHFLADSHICYIVFVFKWSHKTLFLPYTADYDWHVPFLFFKRHTQSM